MTDGTSIRRAGFWLGVPALAWAMLLACGGKGQSDPTVGSESHFLIHCESACSDGSACMCGICTKVCSESSHCRGLNPNAVCTASAPRIAAGRCAAISESAFCDLPCLVDSDCNTRGEGFSCQQGYCRDAAEPAPAPSGSGTLAECQPKVPVASEVLILGDSLIDLSTFASRVEQVATDAGALANGEHFRVHSSYLYSRMAVGPLSIAEQYAAARQEGRTRIVIMDGGETDMFETVCNTNPYAECPTFVAAADGARQLLKQMAEDGVEHVVYFFYPDPIGLPDLKTRLDILRPMMVNACGQSPLVCDLLDLRPIFADRPDFLTSDGMVFSDAGAAACASESWRILQKRCVVP